MESTVHAIRTHGAQEEIWLLEHQPVYTYGSRTSLEELDLLRRHTHHPIESTSRGGKITFHGTGQRVIYPMLDLRKHQLSIHQYIQLCTQWMLSVLEALGIPGKTHPSHAGIWTAKGKVVSIGMRVWQGVTWHGLALNIRVDPHVFENISLCGLPGNTVTCLTTEGYTGSLEHIDSLLYSFCPFLS